jgi:heptosyltransferase II
MGQHQNATTHHITQSPHRPVAPSTLHTPERIMVRAPNWVGDAVMALPALRELRRIFANEEITLVARPWVAGLFEGEGLADHVVAVRDGSGILQKTSCFINGARQLRRDKFDLAVLFQNAFGAALFARVAGARRIAGYSTDRRRALLDIVIPFQPNRKTTHQVRYYLNIAATLENVFKGETGVDFEATPRLHVSDELKEQGRSLLDEAFAKAIESFAASPHRSVSPSPLLVLSPGATNSRAKRWLPERFAATADQLAERNGFQTVIVGTAGDVEAANEVASLMRSSTVVLAGRTSIAELKAILACASLVISNDTGTAHVSAALGVPTVVVFGPTEHFSTRPLSPAAVVVRHDVECSPCMLRDCPIDHRCMTGVTVDSVLSVIAQRR